MHSLNFNGIASEHNKHGKNMLSVKATFHNLELEKRIGF